MKKRMKSVRNTRKAVATLANKLRKYLKDLSRAFRKSWKLVKRGVIYTAAAGVTFRNAQEVIEWLNRMNPRDICLSLCREPENRSDRNAVKIYAHVISMGKRACIGYLKRDLAAAIAPLMDAGEDIRATLYCFTGCCPGLTHGMLLNVEL